MTLAAAHTNDVFCIAKIQEFRRWWHLISYCISIQDFLRLLTHARYPVIFCQVFKYSQHLSTMLISPQHLGRMIDGLFTHGNVVVRSLLIESNQRIRATWCWKRRSELRDH